VKRLERSGPATKKEIWISERKTGDNKRKKLGNVLPNLKLGSCKTCSEETTSRKISYSPGVVFESLVVKAGSGKTDSREMRHRSGITR